MGHAIRGWEQVAFKIRGERVKIANELVRGRRSQKLFRSDEARLIEEPSDVEHVAALRNGEILIKDLATPDLVEDLPRGLVRGKTILARLQGRTIMDCAHDEEGPAGAHDAVPLEFVSNLPR